MNTVKTINNLTVTIYDYFVCTMLFVTTCEAHVANKDQIFFIWNKKLVNNGCTVEC